MIRGHDDPAQKHSQHICCSPQFPSITFHPQWQTLGLKVGDYILWRGPISDSAEMIGKVVRIHENQLGKQVREKLGIPIKAAPSHIFAVSEYWARHRKDYLPGPPLQILHHCLFCFVDPRLAA